MNIINQLRDDIANIFSEIAGEKISTKNIVIESPKQESHGDLSTNIAMIYAKKLKQKPYDLATKLQTELLKLDYLEEVKIAGPGFLNFIIQSSSWQKIVPVIIKTGKNYGVSNLGQGKKVNVEFVSANPTGPMHIGHARGAVYGDCLARLLSKSGYQVTREYYINDSGSQVNTLAESLYLRYQEAATGKKVEIPAGLYPGSYLIAAGQKLFEQYNDELLSKNKEDWLKIIKPFALEEMMKLIKQDLADLGIEHDVFFSEASLHASGQIKQAVKWLEKMGLVYQGVLEAPKGKEDEEYSSREQLLFKSTNFGDDQDRPLQKSDGSWTYFSADIAYAYDKIQRHFDVILMVLGADHAGYVKRIKAVTSALSDGKVGSEIILCQLVNYLENGKPLKMSKRAGNFSTVSDVTAELGKDIIRFIMLTRKNDIILDFDLDKAKEQSKDNPVFYVQYAYVRTQSIFRNAKEQIQDSIKIFDNNQYDLALINNPKELSLLKQMALWPRIVESAAISYEPHKIAFFLQNLAANFHALWNLKAEGNDYKFIVANDPELTAARLAMVKSIATIIESGFDILGVDLVEKM